MLEDLQRKYGPMGVEIHELCYRISYGQGDFGAFNGRVFVADWMEHVEVEPGGQSYAEAYPALYLACQQDGTYMNVAHRNKWSFDWRDNWTSTSPCGIFEHLDDETWDELLTEQASSLDLEGAVYAYCKAVGREIYEEMRSAYEHTTSEESFIEYCASMDITFEVETDSEETEHEVYC